MLGIDLAKTYQPFCPVPRLAAAALRTSQSALNAIKLSGLAYNQTQLIVI
jgi:hypothetical protein